LLSLICTTVMEWIAQLSRLRGRMLVKGTRRLLGEREGKSAPTTEALFKHPLMQDLSEQDRPPSYVPSKTFAHALREVIREKRATAAEGASQIPPGLAASLRSLARTEPDQQKGAPDATEVPDPGVPAIAEWFDDAMDRISGSYKRVTRWIVLGLSIVIAVLMNADTVKLSSDLWRNPTLRTYLVERAKVRLQQGAPLETVEYSDPLNPQVTPPIAPDSGRSPDQLLADEQALLGDLFGWKNESAAIASEGLTLWLLRHFLGWMLTALAISLGAPFWFSTLDRFMRLRATGTVPPKYKTQEGEGKSK
jgi:hypothetical protein